MPKPRDGERLSVQVHRLDVFVPGGNIVRDDGESFAIAQRDSYPAEQGAAQVINRLARRDREKAHRTEDKPGRKRAAVIVAGNSQHAVLIPHAHNLTDPELRLPRLTGIVVKVGNVFARLVAG